MLLYYTNVDGVLNKDEILWIVHVVVTKIASWNQLYKLITG